MRGAISRDLDTYFAGLDAYQSFIRLRPAELRLIPVLDRSGLVLSVANWLLWLYRDGRPFADRAAVSKRLAELVARLDRAGAMV